jgi:carboxylesterase
MGNSMKKKEKTMTQQQGIMKGNTLQKIGSAGFIVGAALMAIGCLTAPNASGIAPSPSISHPDPVAEYAEAAHRVDDLRAAEVGFNPNSRVILLTHGSRTPRVIVFIHGLNCSPASFRELGTRFYDRGYNVLIAPLPYHGLADRMTTEIVRLRAEDIIRYTEEVVDIGRGLGDHLTLAGISLGGLATGWAAQQLQDVDLAVLISPGFGFGAIPEILTPMTVWTLSVLPNWFLWEDPVLKADARPLEKYPRMATHNLAQIVRLSLATQALARQKAPAAGSTLVITNLNDHDVDNAVTARVVDLWRSHGAANLRTYQFPADLRLGHDLIEVEQPGPNVAEVAYPRLLELIDGQEQHAGVPSPRS